VTGGIEIKGPLHEGFDQVLADDELAFVAALHERFDERRRELLARRAERRARLAAGEMLDFLPEDPGDPGGRLAGRPLRRPGCRTGVSRSPVRPIARWSSTRSTRGRAGFMADFEDANAPTWTNMIEGQINLTQAIEGTLGFTSDEGRPTNCTTRPRRCSPPARLHLPERHLEIGGRPASGALVDFGLYFVRNARRLLERGAGPYFYLPKMESHLEARLWNDIFTFAEQELGIDHGATKATVLIETVPAAFEMEEILYELRDHSAGLNAGRWDYIFSMIKSFRERPEFVLPDRAQITMTVPFMRAYTELLVRTCHRRGAHAMGGMAALIPSRRDPEANERALAGVRADKQREAGDGFDGTWVAHPDLVPVATEQFDAVLGQAAEPGRAPGEDVHVEAADLAGRRVHAGRGDRGRGPRQHCRGDRIHRLVAPPATVPPAINNLMEDAGDSRDLAPQVWQWKTHRTTLGRRPARSTPALVREWMAESPEGPARETFEQVALGDELPDF